MQGVVKYAAAGLALGMVAGFALWSTLTSEGTTGETPQAAVPSDDSPREREPAAFAGPGPSRTESGVPAGFERSDAGAVAAAASFVTTGQALIDMDPLAAEDAVRQMASTSTADRQVNDILDQLRGLRQAVVSGSGRIVFRQGVLAYRVDRFDEDRAEVSIWNVGVLSREGVAPPQASWAISSFELSWERGDWRILTETVVPGPAPVLDDTTAPATAVQLVASLDGFIDFGGDR